MMRFFRRLFKMLVASALVAGCLFLSSDDFGRTWRGFVIAQLAERGIHLDFEHLVLNPFGGLVARDVRVFNNSDRQQLLASVDRLNLDIDYGKLLDHEVVLEGLALSDANLVLPVDPAAATETTIELRNVSARAFIVDGRLDLRQAEGTLSGIRLSVTGDLALPPKKRDEAAKSAAKALAAERMDAINNNRERIQRGLEWLKRFDFVSAPLINIDVHGAMDQLQDLSAKVSFEAKGLSYEGYTCQQLRADAEFNAGLIDLHRLHLRDRLGELNASASWRLGAQDLRFRLTSSADLPGLATTFLDNDNLREVVFYEAPHLALDGIWHADGPLSKHKRPVHVTGRLDCGRFSSRGSVFDGLSANLGVAPEGVYLRDVLLRHETGTLAVQMLLHETEGLRYRAVLRMDPAPFLPFAKTEQTREIIRRFQFSQQSNIFVEVEGSGPEKLLNRCRHIGHGELRNFTYRGVDLGMISADVEFNGQQQYYRNVKVQRQEGEGEAAEVHVDGAGRIVELKGIHSKIDPVAVVGAFTSPVAATIARYRLPMTTNASVDGAIHWREPDKNDFKVQFSHPTGSAHYPLWDKDYVISAPAGTLTFKGQQLHFDVHGEVFGDSLSVRGDVDLTPGRTVYNATVKAGKMFYDVLGKDVPFQDVAVEVKDRGEDVDFNVQAGLMGGHLSLIGAVQDKPSGAPYHGELRIEDVSFRRFAQIYSPSNDTEGDLTGHFKFTGRLDDWNALKGKGVAIMVNGNLHAVPILGPLAPILGKIIPAQIKGYNIAKEANCTFEVADGYVITDDLEALTSTFRISSSGRIDFLHDHLDFIATVRLRGLTGIVLMPFSELLEYHGEGSISDPRWTPHVFKGASNQRTQPSRLSEPRPGEGGDADRRRPAPGEARKAAPSMFMRPGGR